MASMIHDDPLQPHSHDNNIAIPSDDPAITVSLPDGESRTLSLAALQALPATQYSYSYTTDHGPHGPYIVGGVTLLALILSLWDGAWHEVEVLSADGFGNRIVASEVSAPSGDPILLCYATDGEQLSRQHGLVRLVVPSETDNALRQVKWVQKINVLAPS